MGQGTHGLLFGVRAPEGVVMEADCDLGEMPGRLDRYRAQREGPTLRWREGVSSERADYAGDGAHLVGVWIAVGASGIDGVPDLDTTVSLSAIGTTEPYAARLAWAREEWRRFSEWCAGEHGDDFGAPDLWLTTLEVA